VRERWTKLYDVQGAEAAYAALRDLDPAAAADVHPNDRRRVVRALELAYAGASLVPVRNRLWAEETRLPTLLVGLDVPRDVLAHRIEQRTREMFDAGVVDEVEGALAGPISSTALKTMGIHEVSSLPREQAMAALAVRTRRYAAYQRKWMRRVPGLVMVAADRPPGEVADEIVSLARAREHLSRRRARAADA
jgi:tRNA dimethylallyltransferase